MYYRAKRIAATFFIIHKFLYHRDYKTTRQIMKTPLYIVGYVLIALTFYSGCRPGTGLSKASDNKLSGNQLRPIGRFDVSDSRLELISSGVHFGVSFEGPECTIVTSVSPSQHNYIQYELDGVYQKRLRVEGSAELKINAVSKGKHTLWIYKATEAHTGPVFIHELIADHVKPLGAPDLPLIEFIGNSITCGAAADPSEVPCGTGAYHDQHNAYLAYGPRVARQLNANFILSSVSGIGIYRNWNSDGPTMPLVYEKTDFQNESSRMWKFERYNPAVVSIALGTNDFSNGDGKKPRLPFDSATFTKNYVNFVKTVKSKYPKAPIVLLNSPMVSGTRNDIFLDCLNRVKRQTDVTYPTDKPVTIFIFKPMKARGCTGHPNVEDHELMADQLAPFLKSMVNQ
jgi:lysophospholipase L1-like esterase